MLTRLTFKSPSTLDQGRRKSVVGKVNGPQKRIEIGLKNYFTNHQGNSGLKEPIEKDILLNLPMFT